MGFEEPVARDSLTLNSIIAEVFKRVRADDIHVGSFEKSLADPSVWKANGYIDKFHGKIKVSFLFEVIKGI